MICNGSANGGAGLQVAVEAVAKDGTTAGDAMAKGEDVAEDATAEGGATKGAVVTPEEEQMVWTVLDGDWRAIQCDVLVGELEGVGPQGKWMAQLEMLI